MLGTFFLRTFRFKQAVYIYKYIPRPSTCTNAILVGYLGTDFTPTDDPLTMTNHPYNHPTPPQTKIEVRNFQDMFYFIICLSFRCFIYIYIYIYNHMAFASPSCTSISKRCAQGQRVLEIVQRVGCPTCSLMSSKLHSNMWHRNIYICQLLIHCSMICVFLSQYDNNISLYIIATYYSNDMIILIVTYRMYRSCLALDI